MNVNYVTCSPRMLPHFSPPFFNVFFFLQVKINLFIEVPSDLSPLECSLPAQKILPEAVKEPIDDFSAKLPREVKLVMFGRCSA